MSERIYELSRENFQLILDLTDKLEAEIESAFRWMRFWQIATFALLAYVVLGWIR